MIEIKELGRDNRESAVEGKSWIVPWAWVIVLCLLSGGAALGHQVLWTRRLIDLLGASAESSARVFGVFFLGLALGSAAAFALVRRIRRPWRWLGWAELAILALAIPLYLLPIWSDGIWPALGTEKLLGGWGGGIKLLLSVALILPPAFLMGWFLPLMAAAILGHGRSLQKQGVSVYGWNTLGGVLGLGVTAGLFLPLLGAGGAATAVLGLNVLTAAACFYLDARTAPVEVEPERKPIANTFGGDRSIAGFLLGLSFLSGFGILALEVVALQMLMLVAPLSFYAPAGILFGVILSLALAAFLAGRLRAKPATLMSVSLLGAGVLGAALPLTFYFVSSVGGGFPPAGNFTWFLLRLAVFVLLICGPVFLVAGLLFPALTVWNGESGRDSRGRGWGLMLAVNGFGGLCGAEVAYRFLLPNLGPYGSAWAIGALYAGFGLGTLFFLQPGVFNRKGVLIGALGAGATILLLFQPAMSLSMVNPHMQLRVLEERSGREGVLAVVERNDFGRGLLVYNQYMLGTTSARYDQARQAHLPLLLHAAPERVAFIGLATGITPGASLQHQAVGEVTAIELSSMVAEAAETHFGRYNHGLFDDPRSRIVHEDGRTYMAAAPGQFDVVVGDLFLPWGPGEARLYSREHFRAVRESLKNGGVFCQWLALYQLRPEDLDVILRTFQEVFPEGHLFVSTFRPDAPALAMVGFRDGELDWETVERRTRDERNNGGVRDPVMRWRSGVELLYLGDVWTPGPGRVNTLNNLLIELSASRERVTGKPEETYLSGIRWLKQRDAFRVASNSRGGVLEGRMEAGQLLAEKEIQLRAGDHLDAVKERRLQELLPREILQDTEADWRQWPGVPLRR